MEIGHIYLLEFCKKSKQICHTNRVLGSNDIIQIRNNMSQYCSDKYV